MSPAPCQNVVSLPGQYLCSGMVGILLLGGTVRPEASRCVALDSAGMVCELGDGVFTFSTGRGMFQ